MHKALFLLTLPALSLFIGADQDAIAKEDRKQIERAALNYVEAFYEGKPELLERSLDPMLAKIGYWRDAATGAYTELTMTREEAIELSKTLHAGGSVPEGATHKIEILDCLDKTAAVRVEAFWGVDYMHLIKAKDQWQIRHVIWQSAPESIEKAEK